MSTLRERLRRAELERAWRSISGPRRVLELGGGNGFQAMMLRQWGHDVTSVDVDVPEDLHHPVQLYDGRHLPFPDASFDVVFSSNVLEHVEDVPALLGEAARVLRPAGVMIHILPSTAWRFWTNVAHYPWVVSLLLGRPGVQQPGNRRRSFLEKARKAVFPPAHGVHANALAELYTYSAARWRRVFERSGFTVESVESGRIYYSGYKVLAGLDVPARQRLARLLGSSCNIFTLRR